MNRSGEAPPERTSIDRWATFGVFGILLLLYWSTLCPTVGLGDSGELITAVYVLGIPHPTGYPLYILLGKFFLLLFPIGEVAFRMNLFSAIAAAGGGAVFYRLMRVLGNSYLVAFSSALTLGCSLSFWSQATVARVYSLNALLICLCIYYGFLPDQTFRTRAWFFFWWGLALANHTISIIVGVLFLALWLKKRDFPFKEKWASLFVLPGLSLYLYIPLRSRMNPPLDVDNPETLNALWAYLSRAKYWNQRYVETLLDIPAVVGHYLATLPEEFTWLGATLILAGIYHLVVKKEYKVFFIAVGLFVMNIFLVSLHGSIRDIFQWSRYLIPGYIGMSLVVGSGIGLFSERSVANSWQKTSQVSGSANLIKLNKLFEKGIPILLPLLLFWSHFPHNDRSGDYLAYDYNYKLLTAVPENAAILPMGDNTGYPMMYLQKVLGIRPDVKLHIIYYEQGGFIQCDPSRELFFTDIYLKIPPGTVLRPDGFSFRLMKEQDPPPIIRNGESWKLRGVDDPNLLRRDFLTRSLASKYWYFLALAIKPLRGDKYTEKLLRHSVDISHDDERAWGRVALYYYLEGDRERAEKYLLGALRINPKSEVAADLLQAVRNTE